MYTNIIVTLSLLNMWISGSSPSAEIRKREYQEVTCGLNTQKLNSTQVLANKRHLTQIECGRECMKDENCLSFNYHTGSGTCDVLGESTDGDCAKLAVQVDQDWKYYEEIKDNNDTEVSYKVMTNIFRL